MLVVTPSGQGRQLRPTEYLVVKPSEVAEQRDPLLCELFTVSERRRMVRKGLKRCRADTTELAAANRAAFDRAVQRAKDAAEELGREWLAEVLAGLGWLLLHSPRKRDYMPLVRGAIERGRQQPVPPPKVAKERAPRKVEPSTAPRFRSFWEVWRAWKYDHTISQGEASELLWAARRSADALYGRNPNMPIKGGIVS